MKVYEKINSIWRNIYYILMNYKKKFYKSFNVPKEKNRVVKYVLKI